MELALQPKSYPLTSPDTFKLRVGKFIPAVFGFAFHSGAAHNYDRAVDMVIKQQTSVRAQFAGCTQDLCRGFAHMLSQTLPENFFAPYNDTLGDALALQACGRLIFIMNDQMKHTDVPPINSGDDPQALYANPQGTILLKESQTALTDLLIRRGLGVPDGAGADAEAIRIIGSVLDIMIRKYEDQPLFVRSLHMLASIGQKIARHHQPPSPARRGGAPVRKGPR